MENVQFDPEENLKRIAEIAATYVPFERGMMFDLQETFASYACIHGSCTGKGLMKIGRVGVMDATMSENCELKAHDHAVTEIFAVYEGDLLIETADWIKEINVGGTISIPVGTKHIAKSINGCKMIAVTIPASKGYPDAPRQ